MHIEELAQLFALHPEIDVLAKELSRKREKHFLLSNLYASAQSILLYEAMRREARGVEAYPQPLPKGKGID